MKRLMLLDTAFNLKKVAWINSAPLFLGVLICLPFIFFNTIPADLSYIAIPSFFLALITICAVKNFQWYCYETSWVSFLFLVFFGYLILSVLLFSYWSWLSVWMSVPFFLLFLGFILSLSSRSLSFYNCSTVFVIVVFCNSLAIVFLSLDGTSRPGGFLVDPNLSANITSLAMLSLVFLYKNRFGRFLFFAFPLLTLSLILTGSRGGLYSFFVGAFIFSLLLRIKNEKFANILFWVFTSFVAALVVSAFISLDQVVRLFPFVPYEQGEEVASGSSGSFQDRLDLWQSSWALFLENPFWGTGLGSFVIRYPEVRLPSETSSLGYFVHNDFLQILVELGVVGFSILAVMSSFILFFIFRLYWSLSRSKDIVALSFCMASIGIVLSHSLVNFVIFHPLIMLFIGALLGLSFKIGEGSYFFCMRPDKWTGFSVVLVVFLFIIYYTVSYSADRYFRAVGYELSGEKSVISLESDKYYDILPLSYIDPLNSFVRSELIKAEAQTAIDLYPSKMSDELADVVVARAEALTAWKTGECGVFVNVARVLDLRNKPAAVNFLNRALRKYPNCIGVRITLAEIYNRDGEFQSAISVLNSGVDRFGYRENSLEAALSLLKTLKRSYELSGDTGSANAISAYIGQFTRRYDFEKRAGSYIDL